MRVCRRRGHLIGESQERVARAKSLPGDVGDEVEQLVDLASVGWKSPLDRRLRSRVATRPIQFTGMEERYTLKSELLRFGNLVRAEKALDIQWGMVSSIRKCG